MQLPNRQSRLFFICVTFLCSAFLPPRLAAQTDTAALSGSILDASGSAIANAEIKMQSIATGSERKATSSGAGVYALTGLKVGHYKLSIEAPGFQTYEVQDLELQVGQSRTIDAQLQVASVGTQVNVVEAAPALASTSAEVGGVVSDTQVRELPLNGRNWASLMTQTPGAIDSGTNNQRSIRFAGRGLDDNNFRFDGVDATGIFNQTQKAVYLRLQFSTEAIAEFRANSALYTAQSGGTQGGQVDVVSRSGTNDFHGSAFEYLRNDYFDARGPFDGKQLPPFRLNQFGGSFGGPIRKDKDFFFADFEGYRQRVGQTLIGFVPSVAFRNKLSVVSPALVPFLSAYPLGTSSTSDPNQDRFTGSGRQRTDENSGLFRFDHRFSDSISLFVRYNADVAVSDVPNSGGSNGYLLDRVATNLATHNAVIGLNTVLSARTINEFRVGFNRAAFNTQNESLSNVSLITPQFATLNDNTGKVQNSNSYDYLDTLSTVHGRHSLQAGMEIRRIQINSTATAGNDYALTYTSTNAFLNNQLSQANLIDTLPVTGFRRTEYFAYVQDEYRVTPTLTANLGVRYEYFGVPYEVKGRGIVFDPLSCPGGYCPKGSSFYKPDYNNFAPRIGLAWAPASLGGRTVIRSGYGIYYGDGQLGDLNAPVDNLAGRIQLLGSKIPGLTYPYTPFLAGASFTSSAPRALDRNRRTPYTQDWGLSLQQALTSQTILTVGYLGTKGTKQFTRTYLNSPDPATGRLQFPNFGLIDYKTTSSNSSFNGLQTSLQRNLSSSLIANVNYLWSHSINDGSTGGGETTYPENVRCRACERASSDQDIRHYLSSSLIYQLPFGPGRRYLSGKNWVGRLLGGWEWSNIFSARSGRAVNITINRPASAVPDGNISSTQRPDVVANQNVFAANQTVNAFLNPAAFATPASKTFGNAGRNLARGPSTWQLDTALSKRFTLTERLKLAFRADAFNVFNHPQFGDPSGNFSSPASYGQITTTINSTGIGTGTPRELQLSLRLEF